MIGRFCVFRQHEHTFGSDERWPDGQAVTAERATTEVLFYGVLLRSLPYPAPDRLTAVWEVNSRGNYARLADPNFEDFRDRNRSFAAVAKYNDRVMSVPARLSRHG